MVWQKLASKKIGDDIPSLTADQTDNFTSYADQTAADANWNITGTRNRVNVSTDVIDFDADRDSTNHSTSYDLWGRGIFPSDTNWTLRFKCVIDNVSGSSDNPLTLYVGVGDQPHSTNANSTSHEALFFHLRRETGGLSEWRATDANDESLSVVATSFDHTLVTETVYCELKRTSGTTAEASLYSDANYTLLIEKIRLTPTATSDAYRYIWIKNWNGGSATGGTLDGTIDDI